MKVTEEGLLHYTLCGLDYVYLVNGFMYEDTEYGPTVAVDDVDGLHHAIAADIVNYRAHLAGQEIRFLRKELDISQSGLATMLGVDQQTVARWEKNQTNIPGPADRLLKVLYEVHVGGDENMAKLIATLAEIDDLNHRDRTFEEGDGGWQLAA